MRIRRGVSLLIAVVVLCALAACQPIPHYLEMVCKVHGTVTDAETGEPIESVEVFLEEYQYSELSNGLGDYELEVPEGVWTLNFVRAGYEPHAVEVDITGEEPRLRVDVALVPAGPDVGDVDVLLAGFFNLDARIGGAIFEEWASLDEWAISGSNGAFEFRVDANVGEMYQTYSGFQLVGTPYEASGVLTLVVESYPSPLTGELTLAGGPYSSLQFDLAIELNMDDPLSSVVTGTVALDGWSFGIDELPLAAAAWREWWAHVFAFFGEAQNAIDVDGNLAGPVDVMGQPSYVTMTIGEYPGFETLIYDAPGGTLVSGSRGTLDHEYSWYKRGEPAILQIFFEVTEFNDGSGWGSPPFAIAGQERWEKSGDELTMEKDLDQDGVYETAWLLYRQP